MKRFILLTFALLAVVFYELSGGGDFEPRKVALVPDEPASSDAPTGPIPVTPVDLGAAPPRTETPIAVATRILKPKAANPKPAEDPTATSAEDTELTEADPVAMEQVRASLSQGLTYFSGSSEAANSTNQLTLASLAEGGTQLTEQPVAPTPRVDAVPADPGPEPDIREVTGTRVNMRDGPGTIYPVLARVGIGHKVEVLDDSGTGWLRLRTLPERQVGWISASLVSKPAR